ncbi:MAG TPA: toll/interleukin-1 receptor domain-containing protein, partial [Rhodospirillales bacterium]|nr:toll/interleukin-1 receptor domain-containing protein [Rhodospirillales bacterium]
MVGFGHPPGKTWDELIERELASASCAVVLWSATSVAKAWVKAEAAEALARGVLVPVLIEDVTPPLAFRHIQAAPLMDWRNTPDHAGFQQVLCSVCTLAGLPARQSPEDVGRAFRLGRMRGKGAVVSARSRRGASLCATPPTPAAKPADDVLAPPAVAPAAAQRPETPATREIKPPPQDGAPWRKSVLASGVLALVAATVGFGLRDALDRSQPPAATLVADQPSPALAPAPACTGPAAEASVTPSA